jgi:cytochrome c-type biogenesis protein CcmH/NrfG
VQRLLDLARADLAANRVESAEATVERALRIEPRNPHAWLTFARVRFAQRQFGPAETMAARANSMSGSDAQLRAENWRLIARAREARGDIQGARLAIDAARRLAPDRTDRGVPREPSRAE